MAVAIRRMGRITDYFVEGTSEDVTVATLADPWAALPMEDLPAAPSFALPAPVPAYEPKPRLRRNVVALAVSLAVNVVLLEVVVRFVVGSR